MKTYISQMIKIMCVSAIIGMVSTTAIAAPITGDLVYSGSLTTDSGDLATAATITAFIPGGIVTTATGDLAPLFLSILPLSPLTFAPFVGPNTRWTLLVGPTTWSYDLISLTVNTQTATALTMTGNGIMKMTGRDDTDYSWSFSADSTGQVIGFSSTNSSVPEPSVLSLLGIGLLGIGLAARRKKSRV